MLVKGKKAMVASAHKLISQTGIEVLKNGGNAVDASVAMALTAGVVLPDMCSIGGDAFMLYYSKKNHQVYSINGSGKLPKNYNYDDPMTKYGMKSVTVPGCVSVLYRALELWGTQKFEQLSTDAIYLSRDGVEASRLVRRHMETDYDSLSKSKTASKIYLNNLKPLQVGEKIYNEDYAKILEYLNQAGVEGFYKGDIAKKIVEHSQKNGGYFELEDFSEYECELLEPIHINYRGYEVYQSAPVSQGYLHLLELAILNHFDLEKMSEAKRTHILIEAKKIAFNQREFAYNHLKEALSKEYTQKLATLINEQSNNTIDDPYYTENGHTTSFVVVDENGDAVSFILSIAGVWGSLEVVDGTGILLNNRAGVGLNSNPHSPNYIKKRQQSIHTLNTWLVFKQDQLKYVGNTPGGDYQVMWNMQIISRLIDEKMNAYEAVSATKWRSNYDGVHHLELEENVDQEVVEDLKSRGHDIKIIPKYGASGASEVIEITIDGLEGGNDPRSDGNCLAI
ncbi:MAG: gamma-glutamyltransferase family protein [Erysipelotrichaceae bacterium]|nr:gamma-glutamyltransferase family protein [Erysipelotrichaceae bacterium]